MNVKRELKDTIRRSTGIEIELVEPKEPSFGDYSTSIAFGLAKQRNSSPIDEANRLVKQITLKGIKNMIEKIEVKGGYINFWLNQNFIQQFINKILEQGNKFGSSNLGNNKRVLVEFVSANPTGPLVIVSGRAAAVGDSLVRILNFTGYRADSEYYVNDCGRQVDLLGESIKARYDELHGKETKIPEGGYRGEYITEIAKQLIVSGQTNFRDFGVSSIVKLHENTLERFGVKFYNWVFESDIRASGEIQKVIDCIKSKGLTYEKDGAIWLKTENKDKVLVKSCGEFSYRLPDIAYHLNKFNRGYEILIDLFGPDQSHIPELKTGLAICGIPEDILKIITIQWVTFKREDKKIGMSKRSGEFVTLDELLDEVGKDAARFFFLTRKCESHLDFDIELAKSESRDNPVYYIQYAGARISSILRFASGQKNEPDSADLSLLKETEEVLIMRKLIHFTEIVEQASKEMSPHYIPFYLMELATLLHDFYEKHRVVSDNVELTKARLTLVKAVKQVISNGLLLIGIETPERM